MPIPDSTPTAKESTAFLRPMTDGHGTEVIDNPQRFHRVFPRLIRKCSRFFQKSVGSMNPQFLIAKGFLGVLGALVVKRGRAGER